MQSRHHRTIADALVEMGLARSPGDARRLGAQGALEVNGLREHDADRPLSDVLLVNGEIDFCVGNHRATWTGNGAPDSV